MTRRKLWHLRGLKRATPPARRRGQALEDVRRKQRPHPNRLGG